MKSPKRARGQRVWELSENEDFVTDKGSVQRIGAFVNPMPALSGGADTPFL